ncbi:M14 family zinc carboxypeptidase [Agromyces sp. SYSU T00266]|uniref:M14 family zinc carboxypeptidase n=1 Tax=Agromyces zhanjiangensis TaxID=3158562 RepID=UPI0033976657
MYRTVAQLDSQMQFLANWFPSYFTRIKLPEPSVQGRPVYALRLRAGTGPERRGVLLVGGTHARELMNPDAIVELAVDLFVSYATKKDLVYGGKTWPASDIKLILEALDIWMVPCANPDGRTHVLTVDDMWRKNRATNAGTSCMGVDLNRNADFMWGVTAGQTSCSPCADTYVGPSAFSEPETRNVKHLLDTHRIATFADVHSYSELILWPWGHAPTQTTDPKKRFTTLPKPKCKGIQVAGYQEYMSPRDLQRFQTVGVRIRDAIAAVRGRTYTSEPSVGLYPTTGTWSDYVYSRHIASSALDKTYGFTFETGPWVGTPEESFHPADPRPIIRDAKSGMVALLQQSICAIELIGIQFFRAQTEVKALQKVRDKLLSTTDAGREWISLFERVQAPALVAMLGDRELLSETAELVKRASALTKDDAAKLTDDEVDAGLRVVRRLRSRTEDPELRTDLRSIEKQLDGLRGTAMSKAVERLMATPPGAKASGGPGKGKGKGKAAARS